MAAPIRFVVMSAVDAGVRVWLDGDTLRIRSPHAVLDIARQLREREAEVCAYLPTACVVCRGPLVWDWPADDRRCTSCRLAAGEDATPPAMPRCQRCGSTLLMSESVDRGLCLVCDLEVTGRRRVPTPDDLRREGELWLRETER